MTRKNKGDDLSRRRVLEALTGLGVTLGLGTYAATRGNKDKIDGSGPDQRTTTAQTTSRTTDQRTTEQTTDEQTDVETTSEEQQLLEQTHSVEDLDDVVQQLETDSVTVNAVPADPDADYAQSTIFDQDKYNGELNVAINLNQAEQQRHHDQIARQEPAVQEFIQNIQDPEWRTQLLQEDETVELDWDTYTDDSLSYRERMTESGMVNFWYLFESERFGGISSTNNHYKAEALQSLEKQLGFNTFIWDHNIPGHGLVGAIENPTRSEENTDQQETYIVETDYTDRQQVVTWDNSQYQNTELHPARQGVDRGKKSFYGSTAIGKDEGGFSETVSIPLNGAEEFIEFFRNPETSQAYDHLDPMTTAAYIAEENIYNGELEGYISLGAETMTLRV